MEDIVDFKIMVVELAARHSDMTAIESLARMIGKVHQATHISVLPATEFQELVWKFQYVYAVYCQNLTLNCLCFTYIYKYVCIY